MHRWKMQFCAVARAESLLDGTADISMANVLLTGASKVIVGCSVITFHVKITESGIHENYGIFDTATSCLDM
jgi:hypothetical protein